MLSKFLLLLSFLLSVANATVTWSIDPSSGRYAEDSLVLQLSATQGLPTLGMIHAQNCSTSVVPATLQSIPFLEFRPSQSQKTATWILPPSRLPAGPLCLQLYDQTQQSIASSVLSISRPSRFKHTMVSMGDSTPWHMTWQRPATILWTRVQLVERDSAGSSQERILLDRYTQGNQWNSDLGEALWMSPIKHQWIRLANAYLNQDTYTEASSWVSFPIVSHTDSMDAVTLVEPTSNAKFNRSFLDDNINFIWNENEQATQYQLAVFQKNGSQWIPVYAERTWSNSLAVSAYQLPAGVLKWSVIAMDAAGNQSNASSRIFEMKGDLPLHSFRVSWDHIPISGALVQLSSWSKNYNTQAYTNTSGLVSLNAPEGLASITIQIPGKEAWTEELQLSTTNATPIQLQHTSQIGSSISGTIVDAQSRPLSGLLVSFQNHESKVWSVYTNASGQFLQELRAGPWFWRIFGFDNLVQDSGSVTLKENQQLNLGKVSLTNPVITLQGFTTTKATVRILRPDYSPYKTAIADQQGYYKLALPRGTWNISVEAQGYLAHFEILTILENAHRDYPLKQGSVEASGTVRSMQEMDIGTPLYRSMNQALVLAWNSNSPKDTLRTWSTLSGNFRFNLPSTGKWNFMGVHDGKFSNHIQVSIASSPGLQNLDLLFTYEARIQGTIKGLPIDADSVQVYLQSAPGTFQTQTLFASTSQTWNYEFLDIKPGTYSILARYHGYSQIDTPKVTILSNGRFEGRGVVQADTLHLQASTATLTLISAFHPFGSLSSNSAYAEKTILPATVRTWIPNASVKSTPATLSLGGGLYSLMMAPTQSKWIPYWCELCNLNQSGPQVDSILWPAFYDKPTRFIPTSKDSIKIRLNLLEPVNTVKLHYMDANGTQEQVIDPQLLVADSAVFALKTQGRPALLRYWFEIHTQRESNPKQVFKNPPPLFQYDIPVEWAARDFQLFSGDADTIRIVVGASSRIQIRALSTWEQEDYSTTLQSKGKVEWTSSNTAILALHPDSSNPLQATILASKAGVSQVQVTASHDAYKHTKIFVVLAETSRKGRFQVRSSITETYADALAGPIELRGYVTDSTGLAWQVPTKWTITPPQAQRALTQDQLMIDSAFIGPVQIQGSYGNSDDTLQSNFYNWIYPNAKRRTLSHDSTLEIRLSDSSLTGSTPIPLSLVRFQSLEKAKYSLRGKDTTNGFYNLQYPRIAPTRIPQIAYHPTTAQLERAKPYLLDSISGSYAQAEDLSLVESGWILLRPNQPIPNYYGILAEPELNRDPLLQIIPNPFSPHVIASIDGNTEPGTAIHINPVIPGESLVLVRMEILNMAGDPVRLLLNDQILPVKSHVIYWDGLTDSGHMVRNGRYLVLLSLKQKAGGKIIRKLAKPVVVFK